MGSTYAYCSSDELCQGQGHSKLPESKSSNLSAKRHFFPKNVRTTWIKCFAMKA